ncbi:MAG: Rrf2 family transcriptional regulator [Rhodospirillales bacterium]|nr:Rrf2 family transcriptional regulator [Rhodospirillales bacterium]
MRLLASTDLALRVLILLGAEAPDRHVSVEQLARRLGDVSRHHLHKIVQDLAALDAVRTLRGAAGGVRLAQPPAGIRLGTLVRALEADQAIVACFRLDGGDCTLAPTCRLRGMLGRARESSFQSLDAQTLADCLPVPG